MFNSLLPHTSLKSLKLGARRIMQVNEFSMYVRQFKSKLFVNNV